MYWECMSAVMAKLLSYVTEGNITTIEATVDTEDKEDYSTQNVIEAMIGKDLPHVNFYVTTAVN